MKEIIPVSTIDATVIVPGSKSLTQRALIAAALADGSSNLIGPLASEDTSYTSKALEQMGIGVERGEELWIVHGKGGGWPLQRRKYFWETTERQRVFSPRWPLWGTVLSASMATSGCGNGQ